MRKAYCEDSVIEDSAANGETLAAKYLNGWRAVREYPECSKEMSDSVISQIENVIKLSNEKIEVSMYYFLREDPYKEWQRIENGYISRETKHFKQYIAETDYLHIAKDAGMATLAGFGYFFMFIAALVTIADLYKAAQGHIKKWSSR